MKYKKIITTAILIFTITPFAHAKTQSQDKNTDKKWATGQIIVKGKAGLSEEKLEQILNRNGGRSKARFHQINAHIVEVPPQAEDAIIKALSNNPNIEYAEKDMLVELSAMTLNDPKFSSQWHLPKIQAPNAWSTTAGDGIVVAILDSGVQKDHPDLINNLVSGWNVVSNNSDTSPVNWHGTAVAGTVAATANNLTGVASVAWGAKIMPVRITNRSDGWALWSDMAKGILWAADHGADVVNMSYEVSTDGNVIKNAAQYLRSKGGVAVAAAGNSNVDVGYADNPYIITVSATDKNDSKASFSNYGDIVDVSAPGKDVYTITANSGYTYTWGTSFASPLTSGVVALIMAANPYLTPDEVEMVLEQSADNVIAGTEWHKYFGHGRVNAATAVELALQITGIDSQSPNVTIFSPSQNSKISGTALVEVEASDNTSVVEVELYVEGELIGADSMTPYQFSWDTVQVADGNVAFVAKAYDAAGNVASSSLVNVIVDNVPDVSDTQAPTVYISNPANDSTVSRTVNIGVSGNDNVAVKQLIVLVDGRRHCSVADTNTAICSWNTRKVGSGSHTITAIAEDAAGNQAQSQITVNVGASTTSGSKKGRGNKK